MCDEKPAQGRARNDEHHGGEENETRLEGVGAPADQMGDGYNHKPIGYFNDLCSEAIGATLS